MKEENDKPLCYCKREYNIGIISQEVFKLKIGGYYLQARSRLRETMKQLCCICLKEKENKLVLFINGYSVNKSHFICNECRRKYNSTLHNNLHQGNAYLNTSGTNQQIHRVSSMKQAQAQSQLQPGKELALESSQSSVTFDCIFCSERHTYSSQNMSKAVQEKGCNDNCCLVV